LTHKKKDCLERPRKKGAKFTSKNIAADEVIQEVATGYSAKRDRWNGYDTTEHAKIYEEYGALETARQKLREEQIDKQMTTDLAAVRKVAKAGKTERKDDDFGSSDDEDEDEEKYADAADAVGQKLDTKTRITVRNLRIREDTAKYLINLDPSSAYYDPKTRSMRDNPEGSKLPEDSRFSGENFTRATGEANEVQNLQLFAWQSAQRGHDINVHANPTEGEVLHKHFLQKKEQFKETNKGSILNKYGGEEYLEKAPKELLLGQTEDYVEYSQTGRVLKGRERAKARSKYAEDAYINNHTHVWGSWYDPSTGCWGYACCHSTIHVSYCTGQAGVEAAASSSAKNLLTSSSRPTEPVPRSIETAGDPPKNAEERRRAAKNAFGKERVGEGEVQLDKERLAQALKKEKKRKTRDDDERSGKRARGDEPYEVTEEQLEAYRMTRNRMEDPMANYADTEV